ncbi:hypothetical protein GOX01_24810 [Gluconobacter oxydans]|nr:hypothetical protein EDC20_1821 [Gluconobacter oxydans]GEC62150.1 hypothetical protein GOX01_24810 [Gluconobacter oxydans]
MDVNCSEGWIGKMRLNSCMGQSVIQVINETIANLWDDLGQELIGMTTLN